MKFILGEANVFLDEKILKLNHNNLNNKNPNWFNDNNAKMLYLDLRSNGLVTLTHITSPIIEIEAGFIITDLKEYCLSLEGENIIAGCGKNSIFLGEFNLNVSDFSDFAFIHNKITDLYKEELLYFTNSYTIHTQLKYKSIFCSFKNISLYLSR